MRPRLVLPSFVSMRPQNPISVVDRCGILKKLKNFWAHFVASEQTLHDGLLEEHSKENEQEHRAAAEDKRHGRILFGRDSEQLLYFWFAAPPRGA